MSNSSIQHRLESVENRLKQLEKHQVAQHEGKLWRKIKASLRTRTEETTARAGGWFVVTVSLLGILNDWLSYQSVNVLFGISLGLGLWLLARSVPLFEASGSTKELQHEHRAGAARHARSVHHRVRARNSGSETSPAFRFLQLGLFTLGGASLVIVASWFMFTYVEYPAWRAFPFILAAVAGCSIALQNRSRWGVIGSFAALYLIYYFSGEPLFALTATVITSMAGAVLAWSRKDYFLLSLVSAGTFVSFARWIYHFTLSNGQLQPVADWYPEHQLIFAGSLLFFLVLLVPFSYLRRSIDDRGGVRLAMTLTVLGFLTNMGAILDYFDGYRWLVALLALMVMLAALGFLSWLRYQRFSYAKYFLFLGLLSFLFVVYLYFDPVTLTLLWFAASVTAITAGFVMDSYTARWVGLATLTMTGLHYVASVLPATAQYAGPVWLHERVWLGVILGGYLLMLASWFRQATLKGVEGRLVPVLRTTFVAAAGLILFALIGYESFPPVQTAWWIGLGIAGIIAGALNRIPIISAMGIGLFILSFIKLFLVDALSFPLMWQVLTFFAFGAALVIAGLMAENHYTRLHSYLHRKSHL